MLSPSHKNARRVLYFDAKRAPASGAVATLALAGLNGDWFYAEVQDLTAEEAASLSPAVRSKLHRISGTHFVRKAELAANLTEWLRAGYASTELPALEIRTQMPHADDFIRPLLAGWPESSRVVFTRRQPHRLLLDEFFRACGKTDRVTPHALIEAIALACCDPQRPERLSEFNITPFEFIMGAKHALGFRAFCRRYPGPRPRPLAAAGPVAPAQPPRPGQIAPARA